MAPLSLSRFLNFISITAISFLSVSFPVIAEDDVKTQQLTYVGFVDGKSYFEERTIAVNWTDASNYCKTSGMHLATVTSNAQATLLNSSLGDADLCFWTGAHDSLVPSQYSWDYDGSTLNSSVIENFSSTNGVLSCICFNPFTNMFYGNKCDRLFNILCEIIQGK